jgi:hypothetical protein
VQPATLGATQGRVRTRRGEDRAQFARAPTGAFFSAPEEPQLDVRDLRGASIALAALTPSSYSFPSPAHIHHNPAGRC